MGELLKTVLPRVVLAVLLITGAYFAFFESVYLQDQAAEFGQLKVTAWMWIFRIVTSGLFLGGLLFGFAAIKRLFL